MLTKQTILEILDKPGPVSYTHLDVYKRQVEDGSFFCFQGADFEVHPAKIIQAEVAFCKTKVKFAIYR